MVTFRFVRGRKSPYSSDMHGKQVLITGGTSGIGAEVVEELAMHGAQLVLLVRSVSDGWTQEYITDLRNRSQNMLIYAEECDLEDLNSVRTFATRWIDNSPPRRLDQVILCAGVALPLFQPRKTTGDGIEVQLGVNYLSHLHLLQLLSPALRAQPADRDVRVIALSCVSYILGAAQLDDLEFTKRGYPADRSWRVFGAAKLYMMAAMQALQRQARLFQRPDKAPVRIKYITVDPGLTRTLSFRRFVTLGTVSGLIAYLVTFPIWWLFIKSAHDAAQTVLYASMAPAAEVYGEGVAGGQLLQDCDEKPVRRQEITDIAFQTQLLTASERLIKEAETRSALLRNEAKATAKAAATVAARAEA
ncbi:hypothetical protein BCR37DRAFT_367460 [Protomyces lactucae-debilis]|uniref:Uncharacterized protein n=1 Tax=Protomyces lactucae-debilis TaxID=2754530 RepID=A0A1Y2FEU5_PROLT|nr:uncharacterized protein BCR37DRAFT_367460 [Protomyces lactucae-debilis]ORY82441.1 hypothetical protein BCR37DRAFT_367460 [Protomyces lactucae-debilis]